MQHQLVDHAATLGVSGASPKSRRSSVDRHIRCLIESGAVQRHEGRVWLRESDVETTITNFVVE